MGFSSKENEDGNIPHCRWAGEREWHDDYSVCHSPKWIPVHSTKGKRLSLSTTFLILLRIGINKTKCFN